MRRLTADMAWLGGTFGRGLGLLVQAWLMQQRALWGQRRLAALPPASHRRRIAHFHVCVLQQQALALQAAGVGDTEAAADHQSDAAWFAEQARRHSCVMLVA